VLHEKINFFLHDYGVSGQEARDIVKELDDIVEDFLSVKASELLQFPINFRGLVAKDLGSIIKIESVLDGITYCVIGRSNSRDVEISFTDKQFLSLTMGDLGDLQSLIKIAVKAYAKQL
jgi:hypothetical protein